MHFNIVNRWPFYCDIILIDLRGWDLIQRTMRPMVVQNFNISYVSYVMAFMIIQSSVPRNICSAESASQNGWSVMLHVHLTGNHWEKNIWSLPPDISNRWLDHSDWTVYSNGMDARRPLISNQIWINIWSTVHLFESCCGIMIIAVSHQIQWFKQEMSRSQMDQRLCWHRINR